jgi:hypothetical protein
MPAPRRLALPLHIGGPRHYGRRRDEHLGGEDGDGCRDLAGASGRSRLVRYLERTEM